MVLAGCGRFSFDAQPAHTDGASGDLGSVRRDCEGHETALFCDGFEDAALAAWQLTGMVSQMASDTVRGNAALLAETQTSQQTSHALVDFAAVTSGTLNVRGWFFVPSGHQIVHFDLLDIKAVPSGGGLAILAYQDELVLYQNTVTPDGVAMQAIAFPVDRWLCIELQLQVADPGSATLLLDGAVVSSFTGIDMLPANGFSRLTVGIPWTDAGQTPARAFTDEVVLDTKPIGCN